MYLHVGYDHFGCILLPQAQDKILAVGDNGYKVPIILNVVNNVTEPAMHQAYQRWGAHLVIDVVYP